MVVSSAWVLLLCTALAVAVPTDRGSLSTSHQRVLDVHQSQQPPGNPRRLTGKFLHITDLHPDPFYKIGADPDGEHPCHRGTGSKIADYYGAPTTKCDSPFTVINATFRWIEKNVKDKIDFVIWTGDSARHDNDDNLPRSDKQILDLNRYVVEKFVEVFGKPDNIHDPDPTNDFIVPIVPTLGNNDVLPHNIFMPGPNLWTREFEDIWRGFIPQEQKHSFARGGWFWTGVIPNKLAVISLNTLYFFDSNSATDGCDLHSEPGYEHMEWLRIQLQFMRDRGMKAIMIGHVPPARTESKQNWDESCYQKYVLWQRQYRDVIVANFYGHMNIDHFMFHDVRDLKYKFYIDGIDNEHLRTKCGKNRSSTDTELGALAKAAYLNDLRSGWGNLPTPPKGLAYDTVKDEVSLEKKRKKKKSKKQKQKDKFIREIGGLYGERFSMSIVSPSVVPNYFPTLRIIEYNITGLKHDHPALNLPQVYPEDNLDSDTSGQEVMTSDAILSTAEHRADAEKKRKDHKKKKGKGHKKKKKEKGHNRKKGKHDKHSKHKPNFAIPIPPKKTALPGPAYSPQTFSLLSWTQLYANLTAIHEKMDNATNLLPYDEFESRKRKHEYFEYETEYTTSNDDFYTMGDLTTRQWLHLAEKIGRTKYKKSAEVSDGNEWQGQRGNPIHDNRKPSGKLKNNELWHEFVRRAYVHSKSDADLVDDFD